MILRAVVVLLGLVLLAVGLWAIYPPAAAVVCGGLVLAGGLLYGDEQ